MGICKPEENGGLALDYSYNLVVAEEIGRAACGGVPLAIGVQTDMATPALARFGSKELRDEFLTPAIAGEYVASIAVSEVHAGSDVAAIKTTAKKMAMTMSLTAARCGSPTHCRLISSAYLPTHLTINLTSTSR